jgi:hypothetical protein
MDLASEQMNARKSITSLPRALKRRLESTSTEERPETTILTPNASQKRCYFCPRKRDRKSRKNAIIVQNQFAIFTPLSCVLTV